MLSPLDMFAIGIGPSSSHTVGPMKAGLEFATYLQKNNLISKVVHIQAHLFGSLALTGEGHGTFLAVVNGLAGQHPRTIDPNTIYSRVDQIKACNKLMLSDVQEVSFDYSKDLFIHKDEFLPEHANGMRFIAYDNVTNIVYQQEYFSIGGGFILILANNISNEKPTLDAISLGH